MSDPNKLRMEGRSKLKIGRKEAHDTGDLWQRSGVERSKVKVSRPIDAETENAPYLQKGRPTNFKLGTGVDYDDRITDMHGGVKIERSR